MFHKTVRFALLLYDEASGRCIRRGGHSFVLDGHPVAPLHKPEGFYVFTQDTGPHPQLTISGGGWQPETLTLEPDTLDPVFPLVRLRLLRAGSGPGFEALTGQGKPGAAVCAVRPGSGRLLYAGQEPGGMVIAFSGYLPAPDCEPRLMVGTGAKRELVVAGEPLPDRRYLLREGFAHHHKTGEPVARAYLSRCDARGRYSIPVEAGRPPEDWECWLYDETTQKWGSLPGKTAR